MFVCALFSADFFFSVFRSFLIVFVCRVVSSHVNDLSVHYYFALCCLVLRSLLILSPVDVEFMLERYPVYCFLWFLRALYFSCGVVGFSEGKVWWFGVFDLRMRFV